MTAEQPDISPVERDPRWRQVCLRDARADGHFVYSVRSTGVYCRPSCGARRPKPSNVAFHASPQDAEAAGFRPCKRCEPERSDGVTADAVVASLCRYIEQSEQPPALEALARQVGLSPSHAHRRFKRATGLTPRAYATAVRAGRLREELRAAGSVTSAFYNAGYGSSGRFYAEAQVVLGMTPSRYRKGAPGERIRFAVGECSLGSILVAATDRGVCAVSLGDDPQRLVQEIEARFPRAELVGADEAFETTVAHAVGIVDGSPPPAPLPLDVRGTAFQQRVWRALSTLRGGETITYAELARKVGMPRAARAVARACAANPLAVAIPCHRVVRTDGDPSGYRWGVQRKRLLLERESSAER